MRPSNPSPLGASRIFGPVTNVHTTFAAAETVVTPAPATSWNAVTTPSGHQRLI
jgi:hypothetical protein